MYPHRIRLRGPWECEPLERAAGRPEAAQPSLPPALRMTIPCRWADGGLAGFAGRVRFRRNFGFPARPDPHERVWLTFEGVDSAAEVAVNGHFLGRHEGAGEPFEFEVTPFLHSRNLLQVDVESANNSGGITGEVALEVRCPAFLRGVRVWSDCNGGTTRLHAAGTAAGTSDRPLTLRLQLDGRLIAQVPIQPTPSGQDFHMTGERLLQGHSTVPPSEARPLHTAAIELMHGSMTWYRVEQPVAPSAAAGAESAELRRDG